MQISHTSQEEKKSTQKSVLITLFINLLLFIGFYFIVVWKQAIPPKPTYGIELNLGFADLGAGANQESNASVPNSSQVSASNAEVEVAQTSTETKPNKIQAVTNQASPIKGETVNTNSSTSNKLPQESSTPKNVEQPKVDQRAIFGAGGNQGKNSSSSSGGNTRSSNGDGVQGTGQGTGGAGYSLDLAGWDFASRPSISDRVSTRNGRIVFKITVDNSGKVSQAIPLEYNVSNEVLNYYRQVVNQLSFKKAGQNDSAEFSTGKITFVIQVN